MDRVIPRKASGYSRREKDNITTLFNQKSGLHFLNTTASQVYDLIDGKRDVDEICNMIAEKYIEEIRPRIIDDVKMCLYSLKNLRMVEWESDEMIKENCFLVGEEEYEACSNYYLSHCKHVVDTKGYMIQTKMIEYDTPKLRTRAVHGSEAFFLNSKHGEIRAALSLVGIDDASGTIAISTMIWNDEDELLELMEHVKSYMKSKGFIKIKAIWSGAEGDNSAVQSFLSFGMEQEAILKKEKMGKDVTLMALFL